MKEESKARLAKETFLELKNGGRRFGQDTTCGKNQEEIEQMVLDYLKEPEGEEEIGQIWSEEGFDAAVFTMSDIIWHHIQN